MENGKKYAHGNLIMGSRIEKFIWAAEQALRKVKSSAAYCLIFMCLKDCKKSGILEET